MDSDKYRNLSKYLKKKIYPEGFTKQNKTTLRKFAKKFEYDSKLESLFYVAKEEDGTALRRLVITEEEKARVFEECNPTPFSGHAGLDNTLTQIKERFYWPDYYKDTIEMVSYKFYFFVEPGAQSPSGFSALARLYYLARPTKTAMLRRLQHRKMQFYSCLPFDSFVQYSCGWLFGIRRSQLPAIAAFLACKIKAFQTMKCCSAKQCYAVVKPGGGGGTPI